MAFERLKTKFDQWSVKRRLDSKLETKAEKKEKTQALIEDALRHPENKKEYTRALHQLARYHTGQNMIAFGKWIIKDVVWLLLPYIPYSQFQLTLMTVVDYPKLTSKILWVTQERLMLYAVLTGVVLLVALNGVIRQGWFHKPYKRGELRQYVKDLQSGKRKPVKQLSAEEKKHLLQKTKRKHK